MAIKKVVIGEKPQDIIHCFTAKVGTSGAKFTDADRGKPVKLIGDSQYDMCADNDPIEGYLVSIENYTADGVVVGTVREDGFKEAIMTSTFAVGDYVVAAAQNAKGTRNDADNFDRPKVKVVADPSTHRFKTRIVAIVSGSGVGAIVTLKRV